MRTMHFGKILELRLFGAGGIGCLMSDELCDEFVSWTNHFERMLAFAIRDIRRVEDYVDIWEDCVFHGLETAGLLTRWRAKEEGNGRFLECFVGLEFW